KNVILVPPDHLNTKLSSGLGMVVETMMAKNRENRYRNPDDLILDLKCLLQGESPMIAGQKPETLAELAHGDSEHRADELSPVAEEQMIEMAAYVNMRNNVIAALGMLLAVSVITNVVFLAMK
ncbi:MAG: serine/threonine protein kinase, partial [Planctomycetota bacterium]|nr:serine/threonine protein kinase [Planctomycetota bacterium]